MMRMLPLFLISATLLAHAEEMQPGLWEISSQVKIPGMQMPANKMTFCYSAKDIREGRHYRPDPNSDCQIANLRQSGNTVSFDIICKHDGQITTMNSKGTFTATAFQVEQKMRTAGMGEMTTLTQGRRLGDCK